MRRLEFRGLLDVDFCNSRGASSPNSCTYPEADPSDAISDATPHAISDERTNSVSHEETYAKSDRISNAISDERTDWISDD